MREPRRGDDEVLSTIDLVVRLNGSTKIVDGFVRQAEAQVATGTGTGADAWFHAGLAAWAVMDVTSHSLRKHGLLMAALDHLSAALRADAEHWPARFMRASYVTMLHSDEADEMVAFLLPAAYGITAAREDTGYLVDAQTRAGVRAPWAFGAWCLAAVQALMADDAPAAWRALHDGLAATDDGSVPGLRSQVMVPVVMAMRRPELADQPALHARLARRCRSLARAAEATT